MLSAIKQVVIEISVLLNCNWLCILPVKLLNKLISFLFIGGLFVGFAYCNRIGNRCSFVDYMTSLCLSYYFLVFSYYFI